ncbi:MAG: uracil-DNA glycosylase [Clostridiaceae bacterium]|jgi:uracil-DNA glycosylase family 4|nr:uracil-DNA glycosylase [Clostridiaceae bacterium]
MNKWDDFISACSSCNKCGLNENRRNVVIGRGIVKPAPILFVGEGPGEQEDIQGEAFVGRAGKLLDLLLDALEIKPEDYYIANVVKCRPPDNRIPTKDEVDACMPWLRYQFSVIKPSIVVCLGATAAKAIIDDDVKITKIRGNWIDKQGKILIMPTYHPAAVLRDSRKREDFYLDIKKVRDKLFQITSG